MPSHNTNSGQMIGVEKLTHTLSGTKFIAIQDLAPLDPIRKCLLQWIREVEGWGVGGGGGERERRKKESG